MSAFPRAARGNIPQPMGAGPGRVKLVSRSDWLSRQTDPWKALCLASVDGRAEDHAEAGLDFAMTRVRFGRGRNSVHP